MTKIVVMTAMALAPMSIHHHHQQHCSKLFTVQMGERAANAVFSQSTWPTIKQFKLLGYIERCQKNPNAQGFIRSYDRRKYAEWKQLWRQLHSTVYAAVASWYNDAGLTASGWHAYYGVANKTLPFGTAVNFEYHGNRVQAIVDDRGPYIGGRTWDLNQNTASALGMFGVDVVHASVYGG